jgi:hypothetical protein
MISSIASSSKWLHVNSSPATPYIGGQQSAGMLRYNTQNLYMEVYDGASWIRFGGHADVNLSPETETTLAWARKKMQEEQEIEELCKQHPALQDAYDRLQILRALVTRENPTQ